MCVGGERVGSYHSLNSMIDASYIIIIIIIIIALYFPNYASFFWEVIIITSLKIKTKNNLCYSVPRQGLSLGKLLGVAKNSQFRQMTIGKPLL